MLSLWPHVSWDLRDKTFQVLSHQLKVKVNAIEQRSGATVEILPQQEWLQLSRDYSLLVSMLNTNMGPRAKPGFWRRYGSGFAARWCDDLSAEPSVSWLQELLTCGASSANAIQQFVCEGTYELTMQDVRDAQAGIEFRRYANQPHNREKLFDLARLGCALQSVGPAIFRTSFLAWVHGEETKVVSNRAKIVVERTVKAYATGQRGLNLRVCFMSTLPPSLTHLTSLKALLMEDNPCTRTRPSHVFAALPNLTYTTWDQYEEEVSEGAVKLRVPMPW